MVNKQDSGEDLTLRDAVAGLDKITYLMETLRLMCCINTAREYYAIYQIGLLWLRTRPWMSDPLLEWLSFPSEYDRVRVFMKNVD